MDEIKVRIGNASSAKSASAVNKRRLQSSTTLNRRFVKKPTPAPRIKASAGAAARTLKAQSQKKVLISKGQGVRLQPAAQQLAKVQQERLTQQSEKVVQHETKRVSEQSQAKQGTALRAAASNTVSLKDLASVRAAQDDIIAPARDTEIAKVAKARMAARKAPAPKAMSAQELKERAIQQALRKVSTMNEDSSDTKVAKQHFWKKKRIAMVAAMSAVVLLVAGYLVSVNLPDISVRVAAMHIGIDKAYPSYVPSSYRLDGLVKEENGRITMAFKNDQGQKFTMMEEKSSWDSSAVLTNYVAKNWGANYTVVKGQGLTIYISGSNAAWVNAGVFYIITDDTGTLNSSDLHDIAVSL
jgi:hypothetical protein